MTINKNFVVKHGLEVNTDLIVADADNNRVGIATSSPRYTLDVNGGIGATSIYSDYLNVSGISTFNQLVLNSTVSAAGTTGKKNHVLISTGIGVSWAYLKKNSVFFQAFPGQTTFNFEYEIDTVEVYVNGVRLYPGEFTANDGYTVVFKDACFGGESIEILASQILPVPPIGIGITIKDEGQIVGTGGSIFSINFTGIGVTVTNISPYEVDVIVDGTIRPPGKTIYVAKNGNDSNDGLTLEFAKKTLKSAVGVATNGDTVKVSPGIYDEDNPIILQEDVSIEGAELRNCIVRPINVGSDLFWVSNGNHITDLSFHGQPAQNNAAVVAFKPLVGVSSNRFFDAARMIRYNLDFIASEAVGYLTSTDYRVPEFSLTGSDYSLCKNDVKSVLRAVCHDIVRGGNSKCVGAGLTYYSGNTLQHIVGVKTETIDTLKYAAGIARSCINNVMWTGNYQNEYTQIRDLSMQPDGAFGNQNIDSCANVISAVYSCVGIVTTIIDQGPSVVGTSFNLLYPGNAGIGTTNPNDVPYQGVGNVTKGPYIRNCTNFIPDSIGMNVDGFHAEPGDEDDMGITGMMNVDSYTQYNQGGIGVKVSNGAYAQLVSIFTICTDQSIITESGGQCDITNSNSSFGTFGLVSNGLSSPDTNSGYHYTGDTVENSLEGDFSVVISGIGQQRPYSGQAVYFGDLYYEIDSVTILNGGSGYTEPPSVVFLSDNDPINGTPSGPSGIRAEASANIQDGRVISVTMIGNGRNYRLSDNAAVTFTPPSGIGSAATGIVNLKPLYYQIRSATLPSAGISTITLAQSLNNDVGMGTTVFLFRQSLQIVSSHSFEYIGAGNTIELARPSKGGVTIQENEVVKLNGGEIVYTSTDQDGNFAIGDDLVIDQATGTIRGRSFERSLLNTVTPFIIALGAK